MANRFCMLAVATISLAYAAAAAAKTTREALQVCIPHHKWKAYLCDLL